MSKTNIAFMSVMHDVINVPHEEQVRMHEKHTNDEAERRNEQ